MGKIIAKNIKEMTGVEFIIRLPALNEQDLDLTPPPKTVKAAVKEIELKDKYFEKLNIE
jgi:hypothetical protein